MIDASKPLSPNATACNLRVASRGCLHAWCRIDGGGGRQQVDKPVTQWRHRRSDNCKQQGLAVVPLDAPNSDPCWRGGPSRSFARYHRQLLIPGSPALCFLLTATNRCRSPAPPRTDSQTAMPLVTLSPQLTPQHALPISGPSQSRAEMACGHVFCHSRRRFALVRPHPGPHLPLPHPSHCKVYAGLDDRQGCLHSTASSPRVPLRTYFIACPARPQSQLAGCPLKCFAVADLLHFVRLV